MGQLHDTGVFGASRGKLRQVGLCRHTGGFRRDAVVSSSCGKMGGKADFRSIAVLPFTNEKMEKPVDWTNKEGYDKVM